MCHKIIIAAFFGSLSISRLCQTNDVVLLVKSLLLATFVKGIQIPIKLCKNAWLTFNQSLFIYSCNSNHEWGVWYRIPWGIKFECHPKCCGKRHSLNAGVDLLQKPTHTAICLIYSWCMIQLLEGDTYRNILMHILRTRSTGILRQFTCLSARLCAHPVKPEICLNIIG